MTVQRKISFAIDQHVSLQGVETLLSYGPAAKESQEKIDGPKQVGTNDGKSTFGSVLSRQILTQPRGSEN
jgi:hypothetical protein